MPNLSAAAIGAQNGALEPQRVNHWFIELNLTGITTPFGITLASPANFDILKLALQRGFNPASSQEEVVVPWMNEVIYFGGKHIPEAGQLEVLDWVDKSIADILWTWRLACYDPTTGNVGLARRYKQRATILNFAPDGSFVRQWLLEGVWPININYGQMDMGASDPMRMAITLRYDRYFRIGNIGSMGSVGSFEGFRL